MKYLLVAGILFSSLHAGSTGQMEKNAILSKVMSVTSGNFTSEVEQYKGYVIVDVYADWCQPCKKMTPIFDALSGEMGNVKFVKLNTDQSKDISGRYDVKRLPTFLFFKDGKLVGRQEGYMDRDAVKAKIKDVFGL